MKKIDAVVELRTLRDMLRWSYSELQAADLYYGHGTLNAWDEAVYLNLHALNLGIELNSEFLDAGLTKKERQSIADLILQRVSKRLPAPYLTHEAWFMGFPFYVDERVLIPRSPIAELIENQFAPWVDEDKVHNVLDLCTGSACIAIACAHVFPAAQVDAVDISKDALAVAKINVEKFKLQEQVHLFKSDLFANLKNKKYDIIVSNPPYVDAADMKALPKEFRHEPKLALQAGKDGLDIVIKILQQVKQHLTQQGILVVEVGNSKHALIDKYPRVPFTWLEFAKGEAEVFLLTVDQLAKNFSV